MIEPRTNQVVESDGNIFLDYLIALAKHGRMIILASAGVMVLTYLILLVLPNKYTATVRIFPPQQKLTLSAQLLSSLGGLGTPGAPLAGAMGGGGMAASLLGLKSPSDLYAGMMTGTTISDRIIELFKLRQRYKEKYIEDARRALRERVNIRADRKDGMITVEVTDKDPKKAAEIANAYTEELNKLLQGLTIQEASSRLAFLQKERSQINQNLALAENNLRAFSEKNSVLQIDTQIRGVLEYIARLRAEIDAKEVQMLVMRQQATAFNYDVVRLETEVQGLKSKLANAEKQYDQVCISDVCLTSSKVPSLGLEYIRLYREVKFQEGLYQFFMKMVELARLDMVKDVATVQVVDRALPPEKRSNKRIPLTLTTGILMFFLSTVFVIIREGLGKATRLEDEDLRWRQLRQEVRRLFSRTKE